MKHEIQDYNTQQSETDQEICRQLAQTIDCKVNELESKIWHAHPVWFLDGNPIVGYSKQKKGVKLMFWSGADFGDEKLMKSDGKFKDASIFYTNVSEINYEDLNDWLQKSIEIQWDYKNIVKRKGKLERLK
jgi:hypothetical protein